ncbi:PLP-dependent aminotransferase family protein [Leisingera methylohalidivorans]|uniref:GntR family transcriptional regulator n=1 Tax=Leisingera methylohalidivorans DSM 14336 TaxID=999552 RepID=V9VX96_9RHOB|nr:PLP-dependent aminotransferase family protein [Leisingera methylohalidivorans]AHD01995.1 GntR family transcriptional regulator [Leisingera methylohalidivorans DSM 14336]
MAQPSRRALVINDIRRRITSRALVAGDRLPSVRGCAARLGVSPSTVADAYDVLAAEGVIQARRGAGFYVAAKPQPFAVSDTGPQLEREVDPLWVARQSLDSGTDAPKPGCGWLPEDWMPVASLRRAIRALAAAPDAVLTDYGSAKGGAGLRRHISRQLFDQGLACPPDRVLLTGSGSQALDLVCRMLLRPGDTVLVDDPCYFNFQALLRAHQIRIIGVPYTSEGPDLDRFEAVLGEQHPRLYLTNSALHNPTGATISAPVAHRVLSLAAQHDLIVVEDDIFAGFEPELSPRLATLDGLERVVRTGSFSKTLSASLRCGYIAARGDWIEALTDLQVAVNFSGPSPMVADLLHAVLTDGGYRKHLEALRNRLSRCRAEAQARLADLGIRPWVQPRGGFYLWCELPGGADAAVLARAALQEGLVLAPGNVFSVSQSMAPFMRFNVSQMQDSACCRILAELLEAGAGMAAGSQDAV